MDEFIRKYKNYIIIVNLLLIVVSPLIFTRNGFIDFSNTGNIGDTIGGITAPFINILNAFLIYITFKEQQKANNSLQDEIDSNYSKEEERLKSIKKLVIFDLEYIIKPELIKLKSEVEQYLQTADPKKINMTTTYVDLNDKRFKSNEFIDYGKIFTKKTEDLSFLFKIYNRISFIYNQSPSQLTKKYPIDPNNIVFRNINAEDKKNIINNNLKKKFIDLEKLIKLIDSVILNINILVKDYE